MKDKMQRLMGKPEPKDHKYDAKMSVLNELRDMAMGMMGEKVKGKLPGKEMKEVSVAAPDSDGLRKGLDLAKGLMPHDESGEPEEVADAMDHMGADESSHMGHEEAEPEDMSVEEIDAMIQELQDHKQQKLMKA